LSDKKKHSSALSENDGVPAPPTTNTEAAQHIKLKRKAPIEVEKLVKGVLAKNISSLSQAITLVESTNPSHQEMANQVIEACLPHAKASVRIGITGVPGVGKSTFIEAFGQYLTSLDKRVAVLAVDPSSSLSKGSILGDKTRMESLVKNTNAFIRPSPSGNSLGGVARKTRESIILCEAAGFDILLIETVGVGQSETAVHSMVDFFLLLKLAGAGDELQGIKRGIIEMADAIVINKADGANLGPAKIARTEFKRALHLYPMKASNWLPTASLCSALHNEGITDIWQMIAEYVESTKKNGYFINNRKQQNKFWLIQTIDEQLKSDFYNNPSLKLALKQEIIDVEAGEKSPFVAAVKLLRMAKNKKDS
jgi:LAO/AO transport system kinase